MLDVEKLSTSYGASQILFGVDFKVEEAETVCILGRNGVGKTTSLKSIDGICKPRSGSIKFKGEEIGHYDAGKILAKGISMVPQGRCNFPLMTVRENLEMGAYTRQDPRVARDLEAMENRFPLLKEKRRLLAGNLSGGEQQILEMAMVLMLKPSLLLLDEPSLGLAPGPMAKVFQEVQRIAGEGTPVVMVEQNARRALEISDQAVVLDLGRVWMSGPGKEILVNPNVRKRYLGG